MVHNVLKKELSKSEMNVNQVSNGAYIGVLEKRIKTFTKQASADIEGIYAAYKNNGKSDPTRIQPGYSISLLEETLSQENNQFGFIVSRIDIIYDNLLRLKSKQRLNEDDIFEVHKRRNLLNAFVHRYNLLETCAFKYKNQTKNYIDLLDKLNNCVALLLEAENRMLKQFPVKVDYTLRMLT